jgi:hypothetical protein
VDHPVELALESLVLRRLVAVAKSLGQVAPARVQLDQVPIEAAKERERLVGIVKVKGITGRLSPADVIRETLPMVYERAEPHPMTLDDLLESVDDYLLWTTWSAIAEVVARAQKDFDAGDRSMNASIQRLARYVNRSVQRHS